MLALVRDLSAGVAGDEGFGPAPPLAPVSLNFSLVEQKKIAVPTSEHIRATAMAPLHRRRGEADIRDSNWRSLSICISPFLIDVNERIL